MTKPWDQEWEVSEAARGTGLVRVRRAKPTPGTPASVCKEMTPEEGIFISAAPDMARALNAVIEGALSSLIPVFGPLSVDQLVDRGQPISISAKDFGAMTIALRKAGVLP